ncbi:trypsin-like serine protease [Silvanigrella paludirubra]|uniref:Trypsin-like serine protease n=1 Tax=Silvanigrella paludirubra TaxID=2499159 RepID=A0A6N6VRG0_9BACT|nr:trypsin-like serine protease [Silvanigrella paludirubra]KAB8038000.1 trypsin-like serine protease [Silvanigrella paludirubra]
MKNILISFLVLLLIYSCKSEESINTRTKNKCDTSLFSNSNRIYDGCNIDENFENTYLESKSVVSVHSSGSLCTGTFIGDNTIITAAHCFNMDKIKNQSEFASIYNGLVHSFNGNESQDNYSRITKIKIHPYFLENCSNPNKTFCNFADLAILKTEKSVQQLNGFKAKITRNLSDSEMVTFIGYGKFNDHDTSSQRTKRWGISFLYLLDDSNFISLLSGLFLQNVSSKQEYFNSMKIKLDFDRNQNLKNGYLFSEGLENENGVCQGDSGGPVFVKRGNEFMLSGVIHATLGNSNVDICKNKKGMHMKIGSYLNWIQQEAINNGDSISLF